MASKQFLGIKYPFKNDGVQNFYLDANSTQNDQARSELLHVVFTPKGQRIRMPEFGTDLIKHIFSPNDGVSWDAIKNEIMFLEQEMNALYDAGKIITSKVIQGQKADDDAKHLIKLLINKTRGDLVIRKIVDEVLKKYKEEIAELEKEFEEL